MHDNSHISPRFEIKAVDTQARTFRGLSSTWDKDLGSDLIHKGAFARTLDHWRQSKRTIQLTDGHPEFEGGPQLDRVLGKMADAAETDVGLETEFKLRDTAKGNEALDAIAGGFIDGLSITYKAVNPKWDRASSTRNLHEVKLHSVGLVTMPMNPGARANPNSVKSILALLQDGTMTDEDRAFLAALPADIKSALSALLTDPSAPLGQAPADTPKGLAPDDPARIALDEQLRALKLRSLTL
jgi:HK97 family phage prohead protease